MGDLSVFFNVLRRKYVKKSLIKIKPES